MGIINKVARSIANILAGDSKSISDYIDLEMNRFGHPTALQCSSGALVSLININGLGRVSSDAEIEKANKALVSVLRKYYMGKTGPVVAWMYSQSTETIEEELRHGLKTTSQTAKKINMDAEEVINDVVEGNKGLCQSEENVIAIWTLPQYSKTLVKGQETIKKSPDDLLASFFKESLGDQVNPLTTNTLTVQQHDSDLKAILQALKEGGVLHTPWECKPAAQWMKYKLNDGGVPRYSAIELHEHDKKTALRFRGGGYRWDLTSGKLSSSPQLMERLSVQLPEDSMIPDDEGIEGIIEGRDRFHACFTVDVYPNTVTRFNKFLKNVRGIDLRMTYIISPVDCSGYEGWNYWLNDFLRANDECKKSYDQYQFGKFMKVEQNAPDCNLQILIVVSAEDRETLITHRKRLDEAMTEWGNAQVKLDHNDPMQTYVSSIPGLNYRSFSRGCWISSWQLARILPNQRPATFWDYGLITFRTEEGQPFYFSPNSNLQSYDLSLFVAPPRQGKSLLMNSKNIASILSEGVSNLGLMLVLDIGPTSRGALQLLRYMLIKYFVKNGSRKSKQEIAEYAKLVKQKIVDHKWDPDGQDWKINPLETRIGFNTPSSSDKEFMISFYVTVCSQPETGLPKEGTSKLIDALITETFNYITDRKTTRIFEPSMDRSLASLIKQQNLNLNQSLFDLRDQLYQLGYFNAAMRAHRLAMPTVNTMIQRLSNSPDLKDSYDSHLIAYVKGMLNSHVEKMPNLTKVSTIDFQQANIISFDMKPVAKGKSNQGKLETFAQYLLAMQLGMRKFTLEESLVDSVSPLYRNYWISQIKSYGHLPKSLALDEWHALSVKAEHEGKEYSKSQAGAEYIDFLIREAPKWGMSINIASHRIADFTETMIAMSTNRFFFSGLEQEEIETIQRKVGLTESEANVLKEGLQSPQAGVGTEIFYQFKATVPYAQSQVFSAKVKYLCSGLLMWALSTDKKDMPHKIRLEREHGDKEWLTAIYETFPQGSMSTTRKEILKEMRERLDSDEKVAEHETDVEEHLYQMVLQKMGANPEIKNMVDSILK